MGSNTFAQGEGLFADKKWILVFIFAYMMLLADGADVLYLALSLSSLKKEFGLTNVEAGALGSITLAAMGVGGVYGGWACDRFGRVRTLVIATLAFSVGTAILGLTHNFWQFAIVRFVGSLGLGAVFVGTNTLMFEYAPAQHRTTILGTLQSGWTVGYVVASSVAHWVLPAYGWRHLFFTSLVPVVFAVLMQRFVKEPPAFLAQKKLRAENGGMSEAQKFSIIKKIASSPDQKRRFIIWIVAATLLQFGYFGVVNWLPTYLQAEMHINFQAIAGYMIATFIASTAGKITAGFVGDKIGRRWAFFGANALTAAAIPVVVFFHTPDNIAYLMTIFGFLYGLPYGVAATYMSESFETSVRGSAMGATYNIGRIGGVVAPITIGFFASQSNIGVGFLVMSVAFFLCGLIPAVFIKGPLYSANAEPAAGAKQQ